MSLLIGNICYFVIEYIDYKEKSIVVEINEENSTMISEVKNDSPLESNNDMVKGNK